MSTTNPPDKRIRDVHPTDMPQDRLAALMKRALDARGIASDYVDLRFKPTRKNPTRWLCFTIRGTEFLYAHGLLLLRGTDRWGRIGRNINGEEARLMMLDKHATKTFLSERGFGVPAGRVFRRLDMEAARRAFDDFAGPICVKPNLGSLGTDVFPMIEDRQRYEAALERVAANYKKVLVEESVSGMPIRFFYIRPDIVAIRYGRPASIVGDGHSTIAERVAARNAERAQRAMPTHPPNIPVDDDTVDFLAARGRTLDDVPDDGERVFLRATSNGPSGSEMINLTEKDIHPSHADEMARACRSVPGLHITAVDAIVSDITRPAETGNNWILELNCNPDFVTLHYPWEGEQFDVAMMIVAYLDSVSFESTG